MQVLVVEDERRMAELLRQGLEEEGHAVVVASNGTDGLSLAQSHEFDAIILDLMLPGIDGFTVAKRLRSSHNQTPILMLTARDAMQDVVRGLDAGGDDYLVKPFSFEVLLARLRAVSRRGAISKPAQLEVGDLRLDPASREVRRGARRVSLTRTEYNLLEALMRRAGTVVTRDALIGAGWGFGAEVENNTLDAFMRLLRGKIELPGEHKLIHTVRGVGYTVREDPL
jgi:DNA-binding response OmpR family regulator